MRSASNSSTCEQWLQNSLMAFKKSASDAFSSASRQVREINDQLMVAICTGDLNRCDQVLWELSQDEPDHQINVIQLVLPLIYQIESDWLMDHRNYSDTLQAFWNLQQWVERHQKRSLRTLSHSASPQHFPKVLLSTAPGCEHNIGILAVSHFFHDQGLSSVQVLTDGKRESVLESLTSHEFDFLGLSIGHDAGLDGLIDFITELRATTRNPRLKIFVGGNIFTLPRSEYAWIGADHLAFSPEDAFAYCMSVAQPKPH